MPAIRMKSIAFRRDREVGWQELERLVGHAEKGGLRNLAPDELVALPMLYRATISSLAVARSIALDWSLRAYLEGLSFRAYTLVYGVRQSLGAALIDLLVAGLPRAARHLRWHGLVAVLLIALAAIAGWQITLYDPRLFAAIVPEGLAQGRSWDSTTADLRKVLFDSGSSLSELLRFSAALFVHNVSIGVLSFASGLAAGLPTLWLAFYNGLVIGAFAGLHQEHGLTIAFFGWLSVHGVTELLAIVLCVAAGLRLAERIVFPGPFERRHALAVTGRETAPVVVGAMLLLAVAALLEGLARQLINDTATRYILAAVTALFWATYFLGAGRPGPEETGFEPQRLRRRQDGRDRP